MKLKKKNSGSVKIDPVILKKVSDYCKETGQKVGPFVSKAAEQKLDSILKPQYP